MAPDDFTQDLLRRCLWALEHNHGRPKGVWSTGEQVAVALVLGDMATLAEHGYTVRQAWQRTRYELPKPAPAMTAWLQDVRDKLADLQGDSGR
ncbi:hypothetical protein [Nonomuraea typhae]|uniref:hypothetical protein n=1 Tax=Nonomuraea typhae TaxID=2603600 RepID=UPI0012F97CB9|nr:hypothetical protein [Nonomuraea typhae]